MLLVLCLAALKAQAQKSFSLRVEPRLWGAPLQRKEGLAGGDSVRISQLRFYVSGIVLFSKGTEIWRDPKKAYLLDAGVPASLKIDLPRQPNADEICLLIGIDSSTNAAGAGAGELDATKGMY